MANGRIWTKEENNYLEDKVGKVKISTIAKNLNRTVNAVISQIERIGVANTKLESGKITGSELSRLCNVDSHTVYDFWIKKKDLPAQFRVTKLKSRYWLIDVEEFWEWAEKNKDLINFTKIDAHVLLPQPDWVELERKRDRRTIPKRKQAKWTDAEDERLINMLNAGYNRNEIADKMQRSERAIQRRISRLRESRRIPYKKVDLRWTDKEIKIMIDLERQGFTDDVIAYELGREADHIRDKRRRMNRKKKTS